MFDSSFIFRYLVNPIFANAVTEYLSENKTFDDTEEVIDEELLTARRGARILLGWVIENPGSILVSRDLILPPTHYPLEDGCATMIVA